MVNEEICTLCGRCCHYEIKGKIYKCKYLVFHGSKSYCRVYRNRLGKIIDKRDGVTVRCIPRINDVRVFEDCPYNKYIK